jgi:hypothetical protein
MEKEGRENERKEKERENDWEEIRSPRKRTPQQPWYKTNSTR